jgi:hypothetical protein
VEELANKCYAPSVNEQETVTAEAKASPKFELTELDGDESIPTRLHGFRLLYPAAQGYAYAQCFEGYHLGVEGDDTETTDPHFFGIEMVANRTGEPGLATALLRSALEEAVKRGFNQGRTRILNPKIISILEKLQAEGHITDIKYFLSDGSRRIDIPAADLEAQYQPATSKEAIESFGGHRGGEDWFNEDAVAETIFKINNQAGLEPK